MTPEDSCSHPYFTEMGSAFAVMIGPLALGLFVFGGLVWIFTRRREGSGCVTVGVLALAACLGALMFGDGLIMRWRFGADDWARLQRELRAREADLEQYGRENPGRTTSQLVEGYLATRYRSDGFHFADPTIPPLYFKISEWRDVVPRVVVSFGCYNNVVFNSATMTVEGSD